ncbi:hypothetical protein GCM10009623_06850 [Nocardioides aestuarii]|uniref:Peptidoglycan recognition protein n=1 Tax=Nocardioides aestuarii TaxID=252231 RepID=A0ABW4TGB2_9ACTN
MRLFPPTVLTALLVVPLLAAPAAAAPPDPRVRLADVGAVREADVALAPGTTSLETDPYAMVAATWADGDPVVEVRTSPGGDWEVLPGLADGPTPGEGEGRAGLTATELVWVGRTQDLDVRVTGEAQDLELVLIDPGSDGPAAAAPASRRTARTAEAEADAAPRPTLRTRKDWGADPRWRNGRPHYNKRLKQVHVHHTATGNGYRRSDVPGIIRGMYRYHTHDLGWFDIGYNFLVDRFGRAWVGRSGGPSRLVRGAHTLGFNKTSVGIAVIGTFEERTPRKDARRTVARLAAWKLDKHGRDATGRVWVRSTGSDKYADGERVRLPVVDGHRDTNDTACPGQKLYDRLPGIRRVAQARIDRFGA